MALSTHIKPITEYVSSPVVRGAAFGLVAAISTVSAYHQICFKPRVETLEASQQRLVTVDITGLVREKAESLALRKDENLDDQGPLRLQNCKLTTTGSNMLSTPSTTPMVEILLFYRSRQ